MLTEKIIVGAGTAYPLKGVLTLPKDAQGPVPGVVMVHGSGSSNMDERVGKLTPFKDLAEGLAVRGIASVRYDKRSFAHGMKMVREKNLTITVKEETIEDAILAAELLRKDERIDPRRIFLIGHSMGAMLAPRIDAEGGRFTGLVLMAGTPRRLEEVMLDQNEQVLAASKGLVRWIVKKQVQKLRRMLEGLYEMTDEQAKRTKLGNGVTLYYFKEMGEHPASAYLLSSEKPLLILQGGKDFQATVEQDFAAYQSLLEHRGHVTYRLYENLNHAFVPSVYGSITKAKQEYNVEQRMDERVIGDIAHWIESVGNS